VEVHVRKKKVPATKKMCPRFEQLEPRAMLTGLADLRVSELMYNPIATNGVENHDLEYIELLNTGVASLNLSNVHLKDAVTYTIPTGTTLTPSGRIVIVRFDPNSTEPAEMAKLQAFRDTYNIGAGVRLFGPYAGKLDNSGELFTLTDSTNATLYSFLFLYGTADNRSDRANGNGSSLEVIYPKGDPWDPNNWRASTEYGGTPGTAGMGPKTDVVINEVLAHTNLPQLDAIELYNTTGAEITIGGWYLSDSNVNYKKFQIPAGTTLPAHGYIVYDEDDFNPTPDVDPSFALDAATGEDLHLLAADGTGRLTRFVDRLTFPPLADGESFGRYPNATGDPATLSTLTLGAPNSYPRVGPVVINQFMYHPPDLPGSVNNTEDEFIQLYNVSDGAITLSTWYDTNANRLQEPDEVFPWKLSDAVAFDFPLNTVLPGHSALYVVSFDPVLAPNKLSAFRSNYGLATSSVVLGPWTGVLSNGGETIVLNRPDEPHDPLWTVAPQLIVDEVAYEDSEPWSTAADGGGAYLGKTAAAKYGKEPVRWVAMTGPGVRVLGNQVNGGAAQRSEITGLSVQVDKNVAASLDDTDLTLFNDTAKTAVPILIAPSFDPVTGTATWNLSDVSLADGYYTATLYGWGVNDSTGKRLDGDGNGVGGDNYAFSFFRLLGDTDGSASVDILDVANVRTSYGTTSGATPTQGDFDGNGTVDIFDVALMQVNYGKGVASAPAAAPPAEALDQAVRQSLLSAMPTAANDLAEAIAMTCVSRPTTSTASPTRLPATSGMSDSWASVDHRHVRRNGVHAASRPMQPLAARHAVHDASWESAVDQLLESEEGSHRPALGR
jgi:hypothetical protein